MFATFGQKVVSNRLGSSQRIECLQALAIQLLAIGPLAMLLICRRLVMQPWREPLQLLRLKHFGGHLHQLRVSSTRHWFRVAIQPLGSRRRISIGPDRLRCCSRQCSAFLVNRAGGIYNPPNATRLNV